MKLIFMGTPGFTLPVLEALAGEHDIVAIYTQPPRPAGHGMKIRKSPVHEWGEAHQIPVLTPETLKDEAVQKQLQYLIHISFINIYLQFWDDYCA